MSFIRYIRMFLLLLLAMGLLGFAKPVPEALKNGDIIFQTSNSDQSRAIEIATHSRYSHIGIIDWKGRQCYVLEAVQPVKLTPLHEWINRGVGRHYVVKRLKDEERLTPNVIRAMRVKGGKYLGKDYDLYFEWTDQRLYCSELVWKIYKHALNLELGEVQRLREFDLSSPVVLEKLRERYGDRIPFDEQVISPEQIFRSPLLKTVVEG